MSRSLPEAPEAFRSTYVTTLNSGDAQALAELLNSPAAPKDARDRLNSAAPGPWALTTTRVESLTEKFYKLELSVSTSQRREAWPMWLSDQSGRFVVAPLLEPTDVESTIHGEASTEQPTS